ncbi:MAG: tRNA glutamyl-Q(34) synthetase GluQRS [Rhodospirillales bacterium]|nr:tRNA glutamyl-Q(34) synthetase GluQRS [Rhodospirillales bacterium]
MTPPKSIVTRFAPSPTGYLHLGHAYAALFATRAAGPEGKFLLRIEDIDSARARPEFEAAIFKDLAWLGLQWEQPVRRQSDHFGDYLVALEKLQVRGLIYPCFCTRKEIRAEIEKSGHAPHNTPGGPEGPLYPGTCRYLDEGERQKRMDEGRAFALRLDALAASQQAHDNIAGPLTWTDGDKGEVTADPGLLGDVVLGRKETTASYHLSVVVDDHIQGVNLVTRGEDLLPSTHVHRLLQALLGYPAPAYHHHRLITNEDGVRLAKRDESLNIRTLRDAGKTPAEVRDMTGIEEAISG